MQFAEYVAIELAASALSSAILLGFVGKFKVSKQIFVLVLLPIFLFVTGFTLRLTGEKSSIDVGYFFTDFSFLIVYLMFAVSFVLGQIKYWKLK